ncbi:MAG TPA: cyclophilin-like family protein [Nitrososphaerales archaeon]|nr:cyclophilin-like family protein [Nitrososphaerales archaeon]
MSTQPAPGAGSVSKVECMATVGGRSKATVAFYRHLAPLTVNSILRSLPSDSRVNLQPSMVCLFTDLRVGVEKPRTQFARGDVAYLPSGGLICIFLGGAKSDRPLNPLGKVESGMETFDSIRRGDVVHLALDVPVSV